MPQNFAELSENILKNFLSMNPSVARYYIGLHEYDGNVPDFSRKGIENYLSTARQQLAELDKLDSESLSDQEKFDMALLRHNIEAGIFDLADLRHWENSPLFYVSGLTLF